MNKLQEHITNSILVKAAITEAVHRYYYDRVLSTKAQDQQDLIETNAANILDTLWNLLPDWRYYLHELPKRYINVERPVIDVPLHNKPKEITGIEIIICLK